jgi:hypothetical protein
MQEGRAKKTAMLLWYADLLCIGVSITRLAFRPFATPRDICAINKGVLLIGTTAGHCYGLDAQARIVTDPETNAKWKHLVNYNPSELACVLQMHPDEPSACYLQIW